MDKIKIYFQHSGNETFTQIDRDILQSIGEVEDYYAKKKFPFGLRKMISGINYADIVFCWFGSWNSFWALLISKLFKKPSILVVGGYDVANIPEANYGNQRGGLMKWITSSAIRMASKVLPFSHFSNCELQKNIHTVFDKIEVVHLSVPDLFDGNVNFQKKEMVLTVGGVDTANLIRKGLKPFVKSAANLPEVEFVLAGAWLDDSINELRSIATNNVRFTGRVSDEELLSLYSDASVYVQASAHEGFGMSVAESMLGGCIPVVTKVGSLPEVVGDRGIYSISQYPDDLSKAICNALNSNNVDRMSIRNRILTEFPIQIRKDKFVEIIRSLQ